MADSAAVPMPAHVLVTGACGLVGRAVVAELLERGVRVTASDLDTPGNRRRVAAYDGRPGFATAWADLTDADAIGSLLAATAPTAVVHLAAVIPPACYAAPAAARRVSVDGTRHLVAAAEALGRPPRLVHASSMAVYGARNPHTHHDLLTDRTPVAPSDLYGAHKAAAEEIVRDSALDQVVLRLGGVLTTDLGGAGMDLDLTWFESLLPVDGRLQTVDVRDVARAFAAATSADVLGETLLIGGDESHRLRQGDIAPTLTEAMGLEGGLPEGRPGDPGDDAAWFATDWLDTTRAQEALDFQRISWPAMVEEVRAAAGWRRYLLRVAAPLVHEVLRRRAPYRHTPGEYADPWGAIASRWGDPSA